MIDATFAHFEDSLVSEEENHGEEAGNLHPRRSIKLGNVGSVHKKGCPHMLEHIKDDIKPNSAFSTLYSM